MLRKKAKKKSALGRIVTGVFALAVALLVAGYAIISSLDVQEVADFARAEVKNATGRDLVIDGPIDLRISLTPSIDLEAVRFANASWGSRPDMLTLRRVLIEVELLPLLFGEVVVTHLVVIDPDVLLERDAEGRGNWVFDGAGAAPEAPGGAAENGDIALPDVHDVQVEGGRLVVMDAELGEVLRLEIAEAVGTVPSGGGSRSLHLEAAYNGNPFTLDAIYGGLASLLSGTPGHVDMTLAAGGGTFTAKGSAGNLTLQPEADVTLTARGDSLAGLAPFLGSDLPALGPYDLAAKVNVDEEIIEISNFTLKVGASDLGGNATVTLAGERPSLRGQLISKLLDVADFSGAPQDAGAAAGAAGSGGAARVFPEEPLPLDGLRAVDARVKLGADLLRLTPQLELNDVQLTLDLAGGNLTVERLSALLAGGRLDGGLALMAAEDEPDLSFALSGTDIDFGDLLKRAEVSDGVGGKLDLDIDLKGRGASPHALAAGLGGHLQAVSLDGTIDNSLLSALSAGLGDITGPLFGQSGSSTRLECLVARFDIEQGQARSRALVLDSGTFAVAGRGGINLGTEQVDLAFDTRTSEPSLASLAVPFRVVGPLADPGVVPDAMGAVAGVVDTVGNVAQSGGDAVGGAVNSVGGLVGTGPLVGTTGVSENLCAEALAAIDPNGAAAAPAASSSTSSGGIVDDAGEALKDAGEAIEKGFKSLFGN